MERKEAIEVIKKNWPDSSFTMLREALETLIPELKESEDEEIRKDLLYWLYSYKDGNEAFVPAGDVDVWITYLEKQGEQQDHSKFLDSIQIGDQVTKNEDGVLVNLSQLKRVAKKDEKQGEQKPIEFDDTNAKLMFIKALERVEEQNAKGYKLTDCDKNSWWEDFKAYTFCTIKQKPVWSEEDEKQLNDIIELLPNLSIRHNWLKSLKDRVLPKPKQEWSEEDNEHIKSIISTIECSKAQFPNSPAVLEAYNSDIIWLKSLKPQSTWKPSDEQIEALESAKENCAYSEYQDCLRELIGQLKKLKEE